MKGSWPEAMCFRSHRACPFWAKAEVGATDYDWEHSKLKELVCVITACRLAGSSTSPKKIVMGRQWMSMATKCGR